MEALRLLLLQSDPSDAPPPLAMLYGRCLSVHMQQDRLVASKDQELITAALSLFCRTEAAVETVSVFSTNEDKDDLSTSDIKYLLVPYYRGSLLSAAPVLTGGESSPSASRLAAVRSAIAALGTLLQRCEQYDMLGALGSTAVTSALAGTQMDPAAKRTFKVEKFKREKALNAALAALESRRAAAAAQERDDEPVSGGLVKGGVAGPAVSSTAAEAAAGASNSSVSAAARGGGSGGNGAGMDEEDERQLWEWRVELAVLQALDLQAALNQEVELLQHAAVREAAAASAGPGPSSSRNGAANGRGPGSDPRVTGGEPDRDEMMQRLRAICRDLDGNRKEQIRQNVFKPSHILPTMTVEEAGEIEMQEAMEREARQKRADEKERARRAAMDSDEEDAEDKAKQRAVDDWRDSHPKGYGNSKLKPCG